MQNGRRFAFLHMAGFNINDKLSVTILICLIELCRCFEDTCSYLDKSRKDRTNHLDCQNYGCCGDFKNRYCCVGPIPVIAGVFGSLVFILIVAVIVGVCYNKYKKKQLQRIQPVPTITAELYNDIPLPSPPRRAPPVYNPTRLHPPPLVTHPFRHVRSAEEQNHPPPSDLHPPRLKSFRS